jgi:cellulose synthase/poly-beta-1,6-N-acetylglucosamine synthase-like glycosyltransferase
MGEGLFIRKSVLDEVGGSPEVLTEDAYLGLLLTERDKRFGIVDFVVVEKAPRNAKAHFTQRPRWHRAAISLVPGADTRERLSDWFGAPLTSIGWTRLFLSILHYRSGTRRDIRLRPK